MRISSSKLTGNELNSFVFLWHTDKTDQADDNGSFLFYLLVIREKENMIRCHPSYPLHPCAIKIERNQLLICIIND